MKSCTIKITPWTITVTVDRGYPSAIVVDEDFPQIPLKMPLYQAVKRYCRTSFDVECAVKNYRKLSGVGNKAVSVLLDMAGWRFGYVRQCEESPE